MATDSPPNKRLKSIIPDPGKFTVTEQEFDREENRSMELEGSDSLSCGICLCDYRNGIRGQIDSCDHYFCFVCIMEWAKVESRCPMCKRRFATIRRPPKDGVFPFERLVDVPKRDQAHHLYGNTTIEAFDPYAQVQCSVCHTASDECLLLLCDLCDSAAHTYCVGLGATVPEGDWFCHDCAVSRTEHENLQKDNDDVAENSSAKMEVVLAAEKRVSASGNGVYSVNTFENDNVSEVNETNVSIFDIVRESDYPFVGRPRARISLVPSVWERQSNLVDDMSQPRGGTPRTPSYQHTHQSDARTLSRCRDVHGYVRALRENWDSLRSGCLRFSSSSVESSSKRLAKCNTLALTQESSGQSHSSSCTTGQQPTTNDGSPGTSAQDRHPHDAEKAWKMMAKAMSIQKACKRTKSVNYVAKNPSKTDNASSSSLHQQFRTSGSGNFTDEKRCKLYSPEKQTENHISAKLKMQSHNMTSTKEIVRSSDNLPTNSGLSVSTLSGKVQTSSQSNVCLQNRESVLQQNLCRASLVVTTLQNGSGHSVPLVGSVSEISKSLNAKADFDASLSCKINISEGDVRLHKGCTESKLRNNDNAKSEIQSLVKLNLKLLKGDKQLGVDTFKEVARLATHTILAACGLEHSRHVFHSLPRSVCSHSEHIRQLRKSTLMPNCCRECFYVFVKDVVNLVLSEKVSHAASPTVV